MASPSLSLGSAKSSLLEIPSVNDENKNEYVIACQAMWSLQTSSEQTTLPNSTIPLHHMTGTTPARWDEEDTQDDYHQRSMLTDCDDDISGVSATYLLAAQDTVKTFDLMMTDEDEMEVEKYWYDKAQSNLNQLFVPDNTNTTENSLQKPERVPRTSASDLLTKMRAAGLQWVSECSDNAFPRGVTLNSKGRKSATATLTSIMSLQSLSIGSIHTLSIASTDSFRKIPALFRFESDESSPTAKMNVEETQELTASVSLQGTETFADAPTKNLELPSKIKNPQDTFSLPGSLVKEDATERNATDTIGTMNDLEDLQRVEFNDILGMPDQVLTNQSTSNSSEDSFVSKNILTPQTSATEVIKPYHAVLGDRSARGPRLTVGTKELRNAKLWFRNNRLVYLREGRQNELFKDAMSHYYTKMSELYDDFPSDEASRERTILIHCSKHAQDSGRVQSPNCFRHANDRDHQYGTAVYPDAVLFYFDSRDPPKLDDQVAKYRRKLESTLNLTGERREYFEKYLEFCEMTIGKAAEGSPAAQLAAEKNNFIPTLKALWEDIEKEMKQVHIARRNYED